MLLKKQKIENFITIHNGISLLIIILALYAILPMLILGDKYIFTIHDSLDNVAGYFDRAGVTSWFLLKIYTSFVSL